MYNNYEIIEVFANNLVIVSKKIKEYYVNEDGIVEKIYSKKFNILNNSQLIFDRWFDIYFVDKNPSYENCIVGFRNNIREIMYKYQFENYLDKNGNIINLYEYSYGIVDSHGKVIIEPIYDRISFNNKGYTVCYNEKFGYISMKGEHITPLVYDGAGSFNCGLACIEYKGKSGYISSNVIINNPDEDSLYAIRPMYDWGSDFIDGYAKVRMNDMILTIDQSNNIIDRLDIKKYYK